MRKLLCGIGTLFVAGSLMSAASVVQEAGSDSAPALGQPTSPEDSEAWREIAGTADLAKKSELATRYLESFPEGGYVAYAHAILAAYHEEHSRVEEFLDHAEAALRDLPDEAVLLVSLCVAYAEKQQPDPAIVRGERALEILPTLEPPVQFDPVSWEKERKIFSSEAHYGIGTAYLFKAFQADRDPELIAQALAHLQSAAELNPQDPRIHFRLGFAYEMEEDYDQAVIEYARSVAAGGVSDTAADERLKATYQAVHGNIRGIEELVSNQKAELERLNTPEDN